jgi:DNA polymerase-3 subunit delta'
MVFQKGLKTGTAAAAAGCDFPKFAWRFAPKFFRLPGVAFTADEAFQLLTQAQANDRLAHAYLLAGPEGSGTRELAERLTGLLVGRPSEPLKHPDVHIAEPESKSRRIVVEQVRELEKELQMRSMTGGRKVGIIFDADRLQEQAANAFLKTLEEPPRNSHLILVSSLPDQLLETILSRCIEISLKPTVRREPTARQHQLLEILRDFSLVPKPDLPRTLGLVRDFQGLLAAAKEAISEATSAALKAEEKHYKQASGVSHDWLEGREEYYKALTDARYRSERSALIETLEQWWGDILRQQHGARHLDHPEFSSETGALAARFDTPAALRRSAAIAGLRENSGRNVQEQLALEVAFLEAFAA